MDILYFKTKNKLSLFTELNIPYIEVNDEVEIEDKFYYSEDDWFIIWLGADENEEDSFLFNIHLNGQDNMDFFTQKFNSGVLLNEPKTPKYSIL